MKNKIALICGTLFAAVSMGIMVYCSMNKTIIIMDVAQDEVEQEDAYLSEKTDENELLITETSQITNYLIIPLPSEMKTEDMVIENHYMDKELWIAQSGADASFYRQNAITGNIKQLRDAYFDEREEVLYLKFSLDDIYEYKSIVENDTLYIEFLSPKEMYEKIVVIDPACGGLDFGQSGEGVYEKDVALGVAKCIKARLDETDIKVYYTRMDDSNPDITKRVRLANDSKADMLIHIGVSVAEDSASYGIETVYNDQFFIPGFGSVELADLLERNVVTNVKEKALGLVPCTENDFVVYNATIPAASIRVGCITNKQEALLLRKEEYLDKLAEGICQAIMEAYEE